MIEATRPVQGPVDPQTIRVRARLADAYEAAGQRGDAIAVYERVLADCERVLGPDHPLTTTARENYNAAAKN